MPTYINRSGGVGASGRRQGVLVRIAFENCPMLGTWETGDWNIAHNEMILRQFGSDLRWR